jgi:DNA-binding NarL/FixJ family response regulator
MNTDARQSYQPLLGPRLSAANAVITPSPVTKAFRSPAASEQAPRNIIVRIESENRLLLEALSRLLARQPRIELLHAEEAVTFRPDSLLKALPDLLLLTSRGTLEEDIRLIRKIRITTPSVHIVMFSGLDDEVEFLQYVRAGIRGYLLPDASAEDVLAAVEAVHAGKAFCPSSLCGLLFRYFELEATALPSAAMQQRLGLTRREQQLVPLIAQGLSNKEIASHFCLSEQTVKNHLYRMKHKVGADNRLGIVQTCHTQGFLL